MGYGGYNQEAIRLPATDSITTVAVAATSTAAQALPAAPGGILLVSSNTDVYARFGASGVAAASASAYTIFIPAGTTFLMRQTTTHVRAIRDSADGVLSFTAVREN